MHMKPVLFTVAKQLKCPTMDNWIKKTWVSWKLRWWCCGQFWDGGISSGALLSAPCSCLDHSESEHGGGVYMIRAEINNSNNKSSNNSNPVTKMGWPSNSEDPVPYIGAELLFPLFLDGTMWSEALRWFLIKVPITMEN